MIHSIRGSERSAISVWNFPCVSNKEKAKVVGIGKDRSGMWHKPFDGMYLELPSCTKHFETCINAPFVVPVRPYGNWECGSTIKFRLLLNNEKRHGSNLKETASLVRGGKDG